jgi:hypothetical protein
MPTGQADGLRFERVVHTLLQAQTQVSTSLPARLPPGHFVCAWCQIALLSAAANTKHRGLTVWSCTLGGAMPHISVRSGPMGHGPQRLLKAALLAKRLGLLALVAMALAACAPDLSSFAITPADIPVSGFKLESQSKDALIGPYHDLELVFTRPCGGNSADPTCQENIVELIIRFDTPAEAQARYQSVVSNEELATHVDKLKQYVSDPQIGSQSSIYTLVDLHGNLAGYHLIFDQGVTAVEIKWNGPSATAAQLAALGQAAVKRIH